MICEHPDCTGVHDHGRPRVEWCPAVFEKRRAANAHYEQTEKGRATRAHYSRSDEGRAVDARYRSTVKGFLNEVRHIAKRRGAR